MKKMKKIFLIALILLNFFSYSVFAHIGEQFDLLFDSEGEIKEQFLVQANSSLNAVPDFIKSFLLGNESINATIVEASGEEIKLTIIGRNNSIESVSRGHAGNATLKSTVNEEVLEDITSSDDLIGSFISHYTAGDFNVQPLALSTGGVIAGIGNFFAGIINFFSSLFG